jgi:hypothetical protein
MSTSQPEKRPLLGEHHHSGYGDDHSINTKQDHGHVELSEGRQRTTGYINTPTSTGLVDSLIM